MVGISVRYSPPDDRAYQIDQPGELALPESQFLWGAGGAGDEALVATGGAVKERDE